MEKIKGEWDLDAFLYFCRSYGSGRLTREQFLKELKLRNLDE